MTPDLMEVTFDEAMAVYCPTCQSTERHHCTEGGRVIGQTHVERIALALRYRQHRAEVEEQEALIEAADLKYLGHFRHI